ncbi:MAG: twin-arginine translocase TatA/TatE family subunit [Alphaproteobacteria bacterium]|nr:twin-arginine translocase TatA/TatE family subunit [Alphaproteobacteria bacterium]
MLDIAWPELVVIGAVALVAIGPKDLPKAMYVMGKWAGKLRAFAHDMHRAMEQVSYEAEIAEKQKQQPPEPPPPEKPHDPAAS